MVRRGLSTQFGYALTLTLFFAVVLATLLVTLAQLWEGESRRERERQLLWVGKQFQRALTSYAIAPGTTSGAGPKSFDDLITDKRFDPPVRHLRRVYADPMTNTTEWGLKRDADGAIIGVYSTVITRPLKSDGLWPEPREFANANSYRDWVFTARLTIRPRVRQTSQQSSTQSSQQSSEQSSSQSSEQSSSQSSGQSSPQSSEQSSSQSSGQSSPQSSEQSSTQSSQ